ncbi:hypothetical protein SAMN05216188_11854 [Lentzea xinjiangensis]|uniref:Uncharacterized protein n=2 Tax=Lentzea xinjiangensis TaxID=402600 RepID=A0A1H9TDI8_9PSEU|nr:hypothetical protein SAMN05216188_11854 [Lentzea xinjiangensis]
MARLFAADGIPPGTPYVSLGAGLNFVLPAGFEALVRGMYYRVESSATTKTGVANANTLPRVDRLVLRLSYSGDSVTAHIKQGTPSSNAQPPVLQQDDTTYEIGIAMARCPGSGSAQNYSDLWLEPIWTDVGSWVSYTPVWSGFAQIGGAVSTGRYKRLASGLIHVVGAILGASDTLLGGNQITASLPVPARDPGNAAAFPGAAQYRPTVGLWRNMACQAGLGTQLALYALDGSNQLVTPGSIPLQFGGGSSFCFQVTYETA